MGRRKKRRTPSPPNSPEEVQYFVEVIMAARKVNGEWKYFVKWYGFDDEENTWEPTENFHGCERLLNSFWTEVGEHKREKARDGIEVTPGKQWIEKERKLSKETREAEEKAAQETDPSDSDEDEVPLQKLVGKTPGVIDSSDDDEPLSASYRRSTGFRETGLLQTRKHRPDVITGITRTVSNKIAKRAAGMDVSSSKEQNKNKSSPATIKPLTLTLAKKPQAGPSKPREGSSTMRSPTATSVSSHPQTTNQAVGNDHRVPGKTQVLPYPIKSSSALSTKARIAEDMAKGPAFHGQSKYKGMRIPKKVNPPGESRSPVISPTTNPQSPLDWSQRAPLLRFSNEHNDQSQIMEAPSQQHPPPSPPSRPEEPSHDIEPDRMDVDQLDPPPSLLQPENLRAAEDLLHTIIPQQIPELMPRVPEQSATRATTNFKLSQLSKRDTKWSGTLFNSVSETDAEKLCEVTIQDHTPARGGMKLDLFLQKLDSIRLRKFHDLLDLDLLLPSFQRIAQFASLVPCEEQDKEAFAVMQEYLLLKEKFTYCTLSFVNEVQAETDTVAYMFIAPMSKAAFALLGVPERTEKKDALLVALAPLTVSTKKYQEEMDVLGPSEKVENRYPAPLGPENSVSPSVYHLARHILRVPKHLVTFLSNSPRPCVIWPEENATNDVWISQDTQYLRAVLNHHRANVFSAKDHIAARVVFVHVGRMKDMHTMPRIARMRGAPLDLQFLTYGTHPSVPEQHWGIRGFNVSGGILTFTPNALVNGLDGVERLIERVASHEHWACYVTPAVLGAAVQRAKDLGNTALAAVISDRLGKRISEGKIACTIAPPSNSHLGRHTRDCDMWVEYQHIQSLLDPEEIVEDCGNIYEQVYDKAAKQDRDGLVLSGLQQDLVNMSNQPAIRYVYRRFVIIKSSADVNGRRGEEDWCEWTVAPDFKFGDEVDT